MSINPTIRQVNVSKLLSNIAIGYSYSQGGIIGKAMPIVMVDGPNDKYVVFDKADFFRDEAKLRTVGTKPPRGGYKQSATGLNIETFEHGTTLPIETLRADSMASAERKKIEYVVNKLLIRQERQFCSDLFVTGKWTDETTPGTLWSAGGAPITDLENAIDRVELRLGGKRPNNMQIDAQSWVVLKNHADLLARIGFGATSKVVTTGIVEQVLELPPGSIHVIRSGYEANAEGLETSSSMAYVAGRNVLISYVAPSPAIDEPSAMYAFTWDAFGLGGESFVPGSLPIAIHQYWEEGEMQWVYDAFCSMDLVRTCDAAGAFLLAVTS